MESFFNKLETRVNEINSLLCVGLDPHSKEIASFSQDKCEAAFLFCKRLIDATLPYAACYKPNAAFFEALGENGVATLEKVLKEIPSNVPILLDVKRGDIGSTAAAYAQACYDHLNADAVTLSPLMGWDSVAPFVTGEYNSTENLKNDNEKVSPIYSQISYYLETYANKGAFLLCKTSNPGSNDLLALNLVSNETVYERIARLAEKWSASSGASLGLVVGATDSVALAKARQAAGPKVWILAPGVGAQGGNLEEAATAGLNQDGTAMLIPVSRGISRADDPGLAAKELFEKINAVRQNLQNAPIPEEESIKPYQKEFLEFSLEQGVLKFGSFVLKSGRTSPYFFNAGLFATGASLEKLGRAYASAIMASTIL